MTNSSCPLSRLEVFAIENDRVASVPGTEMSTYWPGDDLTSATSISMPTGSNRTTCLSAMNSLANYVLRTGTGHTSVQEEEPRAGASAAGPAALLPGFLRYRSGVGGRGPSGRAAAHVVRAEGLPLFRRPLVEQHVRALQRGHPAQVVQRPHLLRVVQVQVRLRDHGLAVVTHVAHVGHDVGPVPAVVEGLPFPLADELAHVRVLPALLVEPERPRFVPPP